jgi:uncharacterized membrane protein YdjX (TVP38/TMEM64 family)
LAQKLSVQLLKLRRYWIAVSVISLLFLILFGVAEIAEVPLLTDPSVLLKSGGILPAVIGVLLLIADVWLPVPSSVIMTANGALFGILIGTMLSLVGSLGATLVGFGMGRAGSNLLRRLVTTPEYETSELLLKKWGILAIIVTRPVPILAETVAILAGASSLRWTQVTIASIVGISPAAFLYALAGATASNMKTGILVFPIVLLLAGIFWWIGHRLSRHRQNKKQNAFGH